MKEHPGPVSAVAQDLIDRCKQRKVTEKESGNRNRLRLKNIYCKNNLPSSDSNSIIFCCLSCFLLPQEAIVGDLYHLGLGKHFQ